MLPAASISQVATPGWFAGLAKDQSRSDETGSSDATSSARHVEAALLRSLHLPQILRSLQQHTRPSFESPSAASHRSRSRSSAVKMSAMLAELALVQSEPSNGHKQGKYGPFMVVQDPATSDLHVISPQATVAAHTATPCRPQAPSLAAAESIPVRAASGGASGGGDGGAGGNKFLKVSIQSVALALVFGGAAAFLRMLLSALPPDFLSRWKKLFAEQPHFDPKAAVEARRATAIYDCHGDLIATVVPGGFGGRRKDPSKGQAPLKPTEVPAVMWQAVIATEDRRFFEHQGFDPKGLTRAVVSLARTGGGSTITQQLVKNVFLSNERRWTRKLVEIILAVIIERRMTKWDILHLYLNKIYWGHGVTGLEAAAALYFGKHPSLLTLGECAMLAGIIPAPELLSPYRDPSRGRKPQARALRRMVEAGFLDIATATDAMQQPLRLGSEAKHGTSGPWRAPFFVSEVLYELAQRYGREEVLRGGLQVHTTLDLGLQDAAERVIGEGTGECDQEREAAARRDIAAIAMKLEELRARRQQQILATVAAAAVKRSAEFRKKNGQTQKTVAEMMADETAAVARTLERFAALERTLTTAMQRYENELKNAQNARLEGAMVAMDPLSGAVRVLVGGRDYYESCFNRATQALRPPGSTFKPVVYLTALAEGITKDYVLVDEPYEVGGFAPENYDRKFRGPVTLEESLVKSLNVPTVKLCAEIGVDKVCHMARALGIKTPLPHELALSLGGCEVTPLQLTTVYCTIAAGGLYHRPHLITRVESYNGRVLEEAKVCMERRDPVVDDAAVGELRKLLQAVVEKGTGKGARIDRPAAGKTGTSDGHRDCWFAGFTPQLACVVWLGYDDNEPVGGLHPGTGSSHAAPLWSRFMTLAHEGLPVKKILDPARERYGNRAAGGKFQKRSRRAQKVGLREVRRREGGKRKGRREVPWKDVWDWEKASSGWEEREKMEEWALARRERGEEIKALRAKWGWLPFVKRGRVEGSGARGDDGGESPGRGMLGDEGEEVGEDDYEEALRFFERAEEGQQGGEVARMGAERGGEKGGEREGVRGRGVSAEAMAAAKWGAGWRGGAGKEAEKRSEREEGPETGSLEGWSGEGDGVEGEEGEEDEACARDGDDEDEEEGWEEGGEEAREREVEEEEEEEPEEVLARMQARLEEQFGVRLVEDVIARRGVEGGTRTDAGAGTGEGAGKGGGEVVGRAALMVVERRGLDSEGEGDGTSFSAMAVTPLATPPPPRSASGGGLTWSDRLAFQQQRAESVDDEAVRVPVYVPEEAAPVTPFPVDPVASRADPEPESQPAAKSVEPPQRQRDSKPEKAEAAPQAVEFGSAAQSMSPLLQPWGETQGKGGDAEGEGEEEGEMEACCPLPPCTGLLPACREPSLEADAAGEEAAEEEEEEEQSLAWTRRLFVKTRVPASAAASAPPSYSAPSGPTVPDSDSGSTYTVERSKEHEQSPSPALLPSPSSLGPPSSLAPTSIEPHSAASMYPDAGLRPGSSAGVWGSAVRQRQHKEADVSFGGARGRGVRTPTGYGGFGGTSRS